MFFFQPGTDFHLTWEWLNWTKRGHLAAWTSERHARHAWYIHNLRDKYLSTANKNRRWALGMTRDGWSLSTHLRDFQAPILHIYTIGWQTSSLLASLNLEPWCNHSLCHCAITHVQQWYIVNHDSCIQLPDYHPNKHGYIDPHCEGKTKKHEWSSNTTTSLVFLSFTKAPGFYQVYVYLSCFSSDSLNRSIGNSPDFSVKNSGDHLPPPLIPRNPCWHPNRKSPWPWTSQRVRRWWPSPPWHLGSCVPRGFSRDPYMVEMWRW